MRSLIALATVMAGLASGLGAAGPASLVSSAAASESLTPEATLPVHSDRDAYYPAAAFGKDVFLVTWQSGRTAPGDIREGLKFCGDIVGCRVDKSGKALDAQPFVICQAPDLQEQPQVAFGPSTGSGQGNDAFLVVWQDLRNGKDWDVYAARVSPEGKVLDPDGIAVAAAPQNQALPRVCWDGKSFLVVWQDQRAGSRYRVWGARVSPEGQVLDPQGVCLASHGRNHRFDPAAASLGEGRSFVIWVGCLSYTGQPTALSGGLLVTDGKVSTPKAYELLNAEQNVHGPGGQANPVSLTAGPKCFLAAWRTDHPSGRGDAAGGSTAAIFGADGQRTKSLFLKGKSHRTLDPEAAWDGSAFVAAWSERCQGGGSPQPGWQHEAVFCSRVSPEGEVLAGSLQSVAGNFAGPARQAAVASDGAGATLIAYEKHPEKAEAPIKIGFRILTK